MKGMFHVEPELGTTLRLLDPDAPARTRATQVMLEEAAWLRSFGTPWDRVAQDLAVSPATLGRALSRARDAGLPVPA